MPASAMEKVNDRPLYCFKYDEATGEIEKITIHEYTLETHYWTGRETYRFERPRINKSDRYFIVPEGKLDRYVSSKVFTFNGDAQNAKRIILETMLSKYYKLEEERLKLRDAVGEFLKANPEFDNEKEAT